jgi:hypothetical protein
MVSYLFSLGFRPFALAFSQDISRFTPDFA